MFFLQKGNLNRPTAIITKIVDCRFDMDYLLFSGE